MTKPQALQLVQDECERLAAKYQLRAYVSLPSKLNKGDEWSKMAFCKVMIGDTFQADDYMLISNEWAVIGNKQHLAKNLEDAFHRVAVHRARHKMHALAVAGQR